MERSLKALIDQAYWTYAQYFYVEHVISLPTPVYATTCTLMGHFAVLSVCSLIFTAKAGQKGELVHTFHFNQENLKAVQTHAEFLADAKAAISEGKAVRGVKSPCCFAGLQYYDIVKGTAVYYMHCVLEGITKFLLHMWFSPSFKKKPFNVNDEVNKDNDML